MSATEQRKAEKRKWMACFSALILAALQAAAQTAGAAYVFAAEEEDLAQQISKTAQETEPDSDSAETQEDSLEGKESSLYEPWRHGYRFVDILNFNPAADPYSKQMRASVPLQERNEPFAAAQVNPDLSPDTKLYAISAGNYRSTDVSKAPWNGGQSYDEFSYHLFKFWQYTDMIGAGGRPTAGIEVDSADIEYGTVALPIPAYVNAAHKNGVLALGEYFVPRSPQYTEEWLYREEDGSFPYAQKLVDMMEYYGFDGYFINQEEKIPESYVPLFREMLQWMREQGCYIQWYDSIVNDGTISYQNAFNSYNSDWIYNEKNKRVSDSIFLNYWYSKEALKESAEHALSLALDPHETVFMGVEGGQWQFSNDLETKFGLLDEEGQPYVSLAIWGSDFYHEQYNNSGEGYEVGYQWEAEERERMYFTSPSELAGDYETIPDRSDIGVDTLAFKGFSRYVAEKSVINGSVFSTDFNNGHGMKYFMNGEIVRDMEWSNVNLQDILPTWQWRVESSDENRLDLDWDYGTNYYRYGNDGEIEPFSYEQIGAYNGGSSLVIYGTLEESQLVYLYKTELEVKEESYLELTYFKPGENDSSMVQAALMFADNPDEIVYLPLKDSGEQVSWTVSTLELGDYAGRTIAAIGLEFSAEEEISAYQFNLGRMLITDGKAGTPKRPEGFYLEHLFDETGEMELGWELESYDKVKRYEIYAAYEDGTERFVGGLYGDNYYIQALENPEYVTEMLLRAVGADGSKSEPAAISLNKEAGVSNIRTTNICKDNTVNENGLLKVTWEEPDFEFTAIEAQFTYWYSEKENPAAVIVEKGIQEAAFEIPLEDGSSYILTLTTIGENGERKAFVQYFGELEDHYCEPYDGTLRLRSGSRIDLTTPGHSDWLHAYVEIAGKTTQYDRFGTKSMKAITIPDEGCISVVVRLEDMDGNISEPVTFLFMDGEPIEAGTELAEELISDFVLRQTLKEKIGAFDTRSLTAYQGELDLSGLNICDITGLQMMTGLTALNLSETAIETVTSDMLPAGIRELNLSGCIQLKEINLNDRPNISVHLEGCAALENLYLAGTNMESLDISQFSQLHCLDISDSQISELKAADAAFYKNAYWWNWDRARLDLSEGTKEGTLAAEMKTYLEQANLPEEMEGRGTRRRHAGSGIWFDGQRPEIMRDELETLEIEQNGNSYQVLELLEQSFASSRTRRYKTAAALLKEADWIDQEYLASCADMPDNVRVVIIGSDGEEYTALTEGPSLGSLDTENNLTIFHVIEQGSYPGEEGINLFDGNSKTKWCYGSGSGYLGFELEIPRTIGKWDTLHAGSEAADYISDTFCLQVLDAEKIREADYLVMSEAQKKEILQKNEYWVNLDSVEGNSENEVSREIEKESLIMAQVYRFYVEKAEQGSGGAVRVYELELYAYEGEPGIDVNGVLIADGSGEYRISYLYGGEKIAETVVTVK